MRISNFFDYFLLSKELAGSCQQHSCKANELCLPDGQQYKCILCKNFSRNKFENYQHDH